jgi:hypothetical protein
MKANFFLMNVFIIFILLSCAKDKVEIISLKPVKTVEELSDSTFFKDVMCITHDTKNIYASDTYNSRILKFDSDMNCLGSIGAHGNGPGEFTCLGGINCFNDTLYVLECNGFKTFTAEGDFIRADRKEISTFTPFGFCMDESANIYLSSVSDTLPLVKYDKYLNLQFAFGSYRGEEDEKISGNTYMLHFFNNSILSVKCDDPVLSLYDIHGNVLLDKYLDYDIFESRLSFKRIEQAKSLNNKRKNTYILFNCVSSFNNKLYLLYIGHDSENIPSCNHIAELVYENNDFRLNKIYQLTDPWYDSICFFDNKLICYSSKKEEFQIYEL